MIKRHLEEESTASTFRRRQESSFGHRTQSSSMEFPLVFRANIRRLIELFFVFQVMERSSRRKGTRTTQEQEQQIIMSTRHRRCGHTDIKKSVSWCVGALVSNANVKHR